MKHSFVYKIDMVHVFRRFIALVKLDKTVMKEISQDESSGPAAAVLLVAGVVIPAVLSALLGIRILNATVRPDLWPVFMGALFQVAVLILSLLAGAFVAQRFFKAHGSFVEYFRVMGFVFGLNLLNVVAVISPLMLGSLVSLVVTIWTLVLAFHAIKMVFHLDDTNAVLTLVLSIILTVILSGMVDALGLGGFSSVSGIVITY